MCVAFMPMHLVVLECKRFKNVFRSCPNFPENFPDFFWNLFSFSLSYFYLLEGSKIFFHELQMFYLDCSCLNLSLGIFLEFVFFVL
jgi:hypothetical protein